MIYKNALITTSKNQFLGWIEIDDNNIVKSINKGDTNLDGIDCNGYILMPAFIDSHTHGGYGLSFDNFSSEQYKEYLVNLKSEGICAFVASSVTSTLDKLENNFDLIISTLENCKNDGLPKNVGWYFEGPFISKAKKGAHEEKLIIPINENFLKKAKSTFKNYPIIFTVDAEIEENRILIEKYQDDFIFALGHSNANYKDAKYVLNHGIKRITHLYNAMSGFSHSGDLGILNVLFNKEFHNVINIEIIADGVHVNNDVIKYTYNNFNINNISLITDSLSPKGKNDGYYKLGNLDIEKRGNWFYLKGTNTLSGSALKYNWIVKNFKNVTNCSWEDIVKVSSYNTARNLNLDDNYGDIIIGKKAKIIIINNDFEIKYLII